MVKTDVQIVCEQLHAHPYRQSSPDMEPRLERLREEVKEMREKIMKQGEDFSNSEKLESLLCDIGYSEHHIKNRVYRRANAVVYHRHTEAQAEYLVSAGSGTTFLDKEGGYCYIRGEAGERLVPDIRRTMSSKQYSHTTALAGTIWGVLSACVFTSYIIRSGQYEFAEIALGMLQSACLISLPDVAFLNYRWLSENKLKNKYRSEGSRALLDALYIPGEDCPTLFDALCIPEETR